MNIGKIIASIIVEKGMTQSSVTQRMIRVMPELDGHFNSKKMSAIINSNRKMTCDEFIAFCVAMDVDPVVFMVAA